MTEKSRLCKISVKGISSAFIKAGLTLFLFLIILSWSVPAQAQTTEGLLTSDEIWSGTVTLLGDVTIPAGLTLRIQPGTTVIFPSNSDSQGGGNQTTLTSIEVLGELYAVGTPSQPIRFTGIPSDPADPGVAWDQIRVIGVDNPVATIRNCIIEYAVVGFTIYSGYAELINNTIVKNTWSGIIVRYTSPLITNNIIFQNGAGIIVETSTSSPTIAYNDVDSIFSNLNYWDQIAAPPPAPPVTFLPSPGTGEISLDPLFVDYEGGDYHLEEGSPCIDAGDPDSQYYDDLDSSRNDMGAYGGPVVPLPDPCAELGGDSDGDGVCDSFPDNCIDTPNGENEAEIPGVGNQLDNDGDGLGDACDANENVVNATAVPDVGNGSGIDECRVSFGGPYPIYTINPELFVKIQYKDLSGIWKDLFNHRDPVVHIIENLDGTWGGDVITITNSDPIIVKIPDADAAELEKMGAVAVRCKFENFVKDPDDPNEQPNPPNIVPLLRYSAIVSREVNLNEWIRIDLKPGSTNNPINCKSKGKTPLVVFGSEDFNACDLDLSKTFLNGAPVALKKKGGFFAHCTDVDEDGRQDLFLHFSTPDIKLKSGDKAVLLTGQTFDNETSVAAKEVVTPLHCPVVE